MERSKAKDRGIHICLSWFCLTLSLSHVARQIALPHPHPTPPNKPYFILLCHTLPHTYYTFLKITITIKQKINLNIHALNYLVIQRLKPSLSHLRVQGKNLALFPPTTFARTKWFKIGWGIVHDMVLGLGFLSSPRL